MKCFPLTLLNKEKHEELIKKLSELNFLTGKIKQRNYDFSKDLLKNL